MTPPTAMKKLYPLKKNWGVHPGEFLLEELQERGYTQAQASRELGFSLKHINQVIKGRADIRPDLAWSLGQWFGTSTNLWLRLQADHHAWKIDQERGTRSRARARGFKS